MILIKDIINNKEMIDIHQDHKIPKEFMIVIMNHMIINKDQEQVEQQNNLEDKDITIH